MLWDEIELDRLLRAAAIRFQSSNSARKQIEIRAYEIYLSRGAVQGHDLEDWLQAEREFTAGCDGLFPIDGTSFIRDLPECRIS